MLELPSRTVAPWLLSLVWRQTGFSKKWIQGNAGIPLDIDLTKSREELGMRYRPILETLLNHIDQLVEYGYYKPSAG